MTRALGIDPGINGGLAVIESAKVIDAIDVPVIGSAAKERVDGIAIREWIEEHRPSFAFIERAGAMPKQGSSSGFKYGRAAGALEATIALSGIPIQIIEPAVWKRALRLSGKDKEAARQRALELFPAAHALLARKRDHGRAEAILIAMYGLQNIRNGENQ
jgi:crossover junction endodeoxyribonuclease RuvC